MDLQARSFHTGDGSGHSNPYVFLRCLVGLVSFVCAARTHELQSILWMIVGQLTVDISALVWVILDALKAFMSFWLTSDSSHGFTPSRLHLTTSDLHIIFPQHLAVFRLAGRASTFRVSIWELPKSRILNIASKY